jgi:hypothetical protein
MPGGRAPRARLTPVVKSGAPPASGSEQGASAAAAAEAEPHWADELPRVDVPAAPRLPDDQSIRLIAAALAPTTDTVLAIRRRDDGSLMLVIEPHRDEGPHDPSEPAQRP